MSGASDFIIENGVLKEYVGPGGDVVMPEGVTEIGFEAFYNCSMLTSVAISAGVTKIGGCAFEGCSGLTSITIPDSVTSIGYNAFKGCSGLTSVTIPEGVTSVERETFRDCTGLIKVTIPESVTSINYGAFINCSCLTDVITYSNNWENAGNADGSRPGEKVLSDSVEYVDSYAFHKTPWYQKNLEIVDGCHYLGLFLVDSDEDIKHAAVREGTIGICGYAFRSRKELVGIDIPYSVKYLGEMAFCGCGALAEIRLPSSVRSIEASCFSACPSLRYFEAASPELEICENSFGSNSSSVLYFPEYAYIPAKIESTGEVRKLHCFCYLTSRERFSPELRAFNDAAVKKNKNNLLELIIEKKNAAALRNIAQLVCTAGNIDSLIERVQRLGSVEMAATLLDWKEKNVSAEEQEKQLTKELLRDPMSAGELKKVWSVRKLPDGSLGLTSYKGAASDVVVPAYVGKTKVTVICEEACYAIFVRWRKTPSANQVEVRKQIRSVTIQDGIETIEPRAFCGCTGLTSVSIPKSVKSIGGGAFRDCPDITIHAPAKSKASKYAKENGIPFIAE